MDATVTDVDARKVSKTAVTQLNSTQCNTVQYSTLKGKLSRLNKKNDEKNSPMVNVIIIVSKSKL